MLTSQCVPGAYAAASVLALFATAPAASQTPPESFGEQLEVRETSVAALPAGGDPALPAAAAVTVTVDGLAQRVTRVE